MDSGLNKVASFKLKNEPYLKPISDLGFGFYNMDENTSILRFQLTNSKGPLIIDRHNVIVYAYFESSNGSISDVVDLEIVDELEGILEITVDKEFLQASTSTKVKGQIYIGVNNVDNNPKNNETVVFREFTFEVADALINKISSFTKIEHIRMFDKLRDAIKERAKEMEDEITVANDEAIQRINNIVGEVRDSQTNAKKDMQNSVDQVDKDYKVWKNEQRKENEEFQTEYKKHWQNFKNAQNKNQTDFEDEFKVWKETQEGKQETFENDANDKINSIKENLNTTDEKVNSVNSKINDFEADTYSKTETDKKLEVKANTTDVEEKLAKKANSSSLKTKANQEDFDNFVEHGYLDLEKGFENYYESDADRPDRKSTLLQFTRVGSLCHIFGVITNKSRLEKGSSSVVTKLPNHLKVVSRDVKVSQGSENNTFTAIVLSDDNKNYSNQVTMERLRDNNGNDTGYNAGKFLNISLTCTVEVASDA